MEFSSLSAWDFPSPSPQEEQLVLPSPELLDVWLPEVGSDALLHHVEAERGGRSGVKMGMVTAEMMPWLHWWCRVLVSEQDPISLSFGTEKAAQELCCWASCPFSLPCRRYIGTTTLPLMATDFSLSWRNQTTSTNFNIVYKTKEKKRVINRKRT